MIINSEADHLIDDELDRAQAHLDTDLLNGSRILFTGGTGFFGFWLLSALNRLTAGGMRIEVTVLSRTPQRFLARHPRFNDLPWLSFLTGDVANYKAPTGPFEYIIHAATDTSATAQRSPLSIFDSVIAGSRRVLDHAVAAKTSRILLVSSGAVYGRAPEGTSRMSESAPFACDSLSLGSVYGEAKRAMESLSVIYWKEYDIEPVIARGFTFVGPTLPLDGHFAIGNFIRDAMTGGPVIVKGDGSPLRSYLYGADMAIWLLVLLTRGTAGRCYNLGSDEAISVGDLAALVRDTLAPDAAIQFQNAKETGPRSCYVPDISRARNELGLAPWTDLRAAIAATARWQRLAALS